MAAQEATFTCPITREIMEDPVVTADGHSYERRAIEEWLQRKWTSPVTGQRLVTGLDPTLRRL